MRQRWQIPTGRPRTEDERERLVFVGGRIPEGLRARLDAWCEEHGIGVSEALRLAVERLVSEESSKHDDGKGPEVE